MIVRPIRRRLGGVALVGAVLLGVVPSPAGTGEALVAPLRDATAATPTAARPLPAIDPVRGRVVVLDPGHRRGNRHHRAEIARPVDAGGFTKPCNTTGTATAAGVPESAVNWAISRLVAKRLRAAGVTVLLTRRDDRDDRWGPCVDARGRLGNPGTGGPVADLRVSIHADGSTRRGARGFHVISPSASASVPAGTAAASARLARRVRDALVATGSSVANYVAAAGLQRRADLATLNLSVAPSVLVETGNLRDARDARRLVGARGRSQVAEGIARGILATLRTR